MFKKRLTQVMYNADTGSTGGPGEGEVDGEQTPDGGIVDDNGTDNKDTDKPISAEEIKKMIQSETDKVRGEYSKKLKEKESELEELQIATMTEEERKTAESDKLREDLNRRESELKHKELTLETIGVLKEKNLPLEARDFLIGNDKETTDANIETFAKMYANAIEEEVTQRFRKNGRDHESSTDKNGRYTKEDLSSMTADEINSNWEKIQRDLS